MSSPGVLSGLQYKVDDNPPWITTVLLALQVKIFIYHAVHQVLRRTNTQSTIDRLYIYSPQKTGNMRKDMIFNFHNNFK